jgi:hypothetical protein
MGFVGAGILHERENIDVIKVKQNKFMLKH